jgi:phenylalanyl-tRNA synthetase beta chain
MPTIEVKADRLFNKLGFSLDKNELEVFFFDYGLELDDIVSERSKKFKETGIDDPNESDEKILKIEVPANRYDLLCEEGIARALAVFKGKQSVPTYKLVPGKEEIIVDDSVANVREFVVCGILRGINFENDDVYQNFITLQTKLHMTVCRRRTLASIGTHDLDTIQGPFYYTALSPEKIVFVPLNRNEKVNGHELMDLLKDDTHLGPFLDIIKDKPHYPVIIDKNGVVLSLPPIINGEHSKITPRTKNVLIEVTATDLTKATLVLNTVVTMFSEYCTTPFQIEQVTTISKTERIVYPSFENRNVQVDVDYLNRGIGINIEPDSLAGLLGKMSIPAVLSDDKKVLTASITPTRSDIFHKCDLVEDIAIAYGFNKIPFRTPTTNTYGGQSQINYLSDKIRNEVARNGFTELLTFSLLSRDENFKKMNLENDGSAVELSNSLTEFQLARTSLLPGILKTLECNKEVPLPIKVFEVSDVMYLDNTSEVGARNKRQLCAVVCDTVSSFEVIHGLLNQLMTVLQYTWKDDKKGYILVPSSHPSFLEGRRGDIIAIINGKKTTIGKLGVIHPQVVNNFELLCACSALLLDVQFFIDN